MSVFGAILPFYVPISCFCDRLCRFCVRRETFFGHKPYLRHISPESVIVMLLMCIVTPAYHKHSGTGRLFGRG